MSPKLQVHLLGDFRLVYDRQPLTGLDSPRLQSLLAYLLFHRDSPQSRQYLAFLFWPDSSESRARNNLRQTLYLLRHLLPDADCFLSAGAQTVQWLPDSSFALDVADFERASQHANSLDSLQHAANLYHGELLRAVTTTGSCQNVSDCGKSSAPCWNGCSSCSRAKAIIALPFDMPNVSCDQTRCARRPN